MAAAWWKWPFNRVGGDPETGVRVISLEIASAVASTGKKS